MSIKYKQIGDYQIPNLTHTATEKTYGKWGQLRREYLQKHREGEYNLLTMKGELITHLNEIDKQAQDMWDTIMEKLEKVEPPLGKDDFMAWVRYINNHRNIAADFVRNDLVYR